MICTGSVPRQVPNIEVDHENIYDSDSILSMTYLPQSLTVLGGGVIASEYASIFASLGVRVTMIDRYPRPLGFLDAALTDKFVHAFEAEGGRFIANAQIGRVYWDGISQVVTKLEDGTSFRSEKLLSATGRVANVKGLQIERAGLSLNERGVISVDSHCRTAVANIFAAGDVIGPPSLASASMEQGRRASCSALGLDLGEMSSMIPAGIYAIPELSTVGLSEEQAIARHGAAIVGVAPFEEIARGQISGIQDGLLRMIADPAGRNCWASRLSVRGLRKISTSARWLCWQAWTSMPLSRISSISPHWRRRTGWPPCILSASAVASSLPQFGAGLHPGCAQYCLRRILGELSH